MSDIDFWGHGKYDGDNTSIVHVNMVNMMIHQPTYKDFWNNINLTNGKPIHDLNKWNVGKDKIQSEAVLAVFNTWYKIEQSFSQPKKTSNGKLIWNEKGALDYMMAADFFMTHNHYLPLGLKEKASDALEFLIFGSHTHSFDNPSARKQVLKKFLNQLDDFPEISLKDIDLFVYRNPKKPDTLIVYNVINDKIKIKESEEIKEEDLKANGYLGYTVMDMTDNRVYGTFTLDGPKTKKSFKP